MYTYFVIVAILVIPYGLLTRNPQKHSNLWSFLNRLATYLVGLKWNTIGQENVDRNETYVVVSNHQTALDVLAVAFILKSFNKCTFVVKKELKYIPILGLSGILAGCIFLNRSRNESSRKAINEAGQKAKESGIRYKS